MSKCTKVLRLMKRRTFHPNPRHQIIVVQGSENRTPWKKMKIRPPTSKRRLTRGQKKPKRQRTSNQRSRTPGWLTTAFLWILLLPQGCKTNQEDVQRRKARFRIHYSLPSKKPNWGKSSKESKLGLASKNLCTFFGERLRRTTQQCTLAPAGSVSNLSHIGGTSDVCMVVVLVGQVFRKVHVFLSTASRRSFVPRKLTAEEVEVLQRGNGRARRAIKAKARAEQVVSKMMRIQIQTLL